MELTAEAMESFTDKDSKVERFRRLYEESDFLTAYARHTDLRVQDDPKWAIGRGDEWETHGKMQLAFLKSEGMRPEHTLLDVGCGVGRAARKFVPFLRTGNYTGIDISTDALTHALKLSVEEGWSEKRPTFEANSDIDIDDEFDFIWAHSVFTHLPDWAIDKMIGNASTRLRKAFVFTYKMAPAPRRSGLKQFQYPFEFFQELAVRHGLRAEKVKDMWPAGQRTIRLTLP